MFYSRKINNETKKVEVWECEWLNKGSAMAKKEFIRKAGDEDTFEFSHDDYSTASAVCWAPNTTIGNIAVSSEEAFGMFDGAFGNDAVLPCQIIPSGKFRHGAKRWYCKTHQIHWGTKADFAAAEEFGEVKCSNHLTKMNYVINPLDLEFNEFEEIGIWCSLPPGLSTEMIVPRAPKIHVHKRFSNSPIKKLDRDFDAIVCSYSQELGLFKNTEITKIQVTPPAAFEFVRSLEEGREMSCVSCQRCGYPHLDLGDFAIKPHKKHFCGNCGNDSMWSTGPIVSTPLKPLHDQFNNSNTYVNPEKELNLDVFDGYRFEMWASTPAVVWTANRPQEKGIHVHVYEGGQRIEDDTFSSVIYQGKLLDRNVLWGNMIKNTIY
jgi:hypothetical protein